MASKASAVSITPLLVNKGVAAQLCGLTKFQLNRLAIRHPDLPIYKLGPKKFLVAPQELILFLKCHYGPGSDCRGLPGLHKPIVTEPAPRRPRGRPRKIVAPAAPPAIAAETGGDA